MREIHPVGSRPQAFVKFVQRGGTKTVGRLKNQMDYLGRKGEVPLERSERYQGISVGKQDYDRVANDWVHRAQSSRADSDFTTHMIISFPAETDHAKAKAAATAFADEMFGSGNYGGQYDYLTVFHTDRPHPHLHILVNRRSLDNENWLKISKRDEYMNYENMRNVLVATAAKHGVFLEATSRKERGIEGNPITLEEYHQLARGDVFFSSRSKPSDGYTPDFTVDPEEYDTDDIAMPPAQSAAAGINDPYDTEGGARKRKRDESQPQSAAAGINEPYDADTEGRAPKRRPGDTPVQSAVVDIDMGYDGDDESRDRTKRKRSDEDELNTADTGKQPDTKRNRTGRNR